MAILVDKFKKHLPAPDANMIALEYGFPIGLASGILEDLLDVGVVAKVYVDSRVQEFGYMPAVDINALTVKSLLEKLSSNGASDFIPGFNDKFKEISDTVDKISSYKDDDDILISNLTINN